MNYASSMTQICAEIACYVYSLAMLEPQLTEFNSQCLIHQSNSMTTNGAPRDFSHH